jgi:mono/diheme cytochrome c family protein
MVAGLVALTPGRVSAQTLKKETAKHLATLDGAENFKAYCAVCHGEKARGDGPAAKALKTPPADLTLLAKKNGGTFSQTDVEATIRGTKATSSHGTREMPMWGPVFRSMDGDDTVTLRVHNLVQYLRSLQAQ